MFNFSYDKAFTRNIGWITEAEQNVIKNKKIAIGGLGGVGGSYLLALSRLGIQNFSISDLDFFELSNFNRQVGASINTLSKSKISVMSEMAKNINPNINLDLFADGLSNDNYIAFLKDADIFLDSLDLYVTPLKLKIFEHCYHNNIPVITAAPIGMSTSLLVFDKNSMSPTDYFGIPTTDSIENQILKFLVGVNPSMRSLKNLVFSKGFDLKQKKLPSLILGIELATSVACSTVLKILLQRGQVIKAPKTLHFDAFENKHYITNRPFGSKNPLQKWMYKILKKKYD